MLNTYQAKSWNAVHPSVDPHLNAPGCRQVYIASTRVAPSVTLASSCFHSSPLFTTFSANVSSKIVFSSSVNILSTVPSHCWWYTQINPIQFCDDIFTFTKLNHHLPPISPFSLSVINSENWAVLIDNSKLWTFQFFSDKTSQELQICPMGKVSFI